MKQTKEYCCRYYHDGSWWGLNITAYNSEDAQARADKLGNLQLLGELMMTIPCGNTKSAWIPNLICWIKNALHRSGERS